MIGRHEALRAILVLNLVGLAGPALGQVETEAEQRADGTYFIYDAELGTIPDQATEAELALRLFRMMWADGDVPENAGEILRAERTDVYSVFRFNTLETWIDRSGGAVEIVDRFRYGYFNPEIGMRAEPSEAVVRRQTRQYVDRLAEHGFLEGVTLDLRGAEISHLKLEGSTSRADERDQRDADLEGPVVVHTQVAISRVLDGVPIEDEGIHLTIGPKGDLLRVSLFLRFDVEEAIARVTSPEVDVRKLLQDEAGTGEVVIEEDQIVYRFEAEKRQVLLPTRRITFVVRTPAEGYRNKIIESKRRTVYVAMREP
jgi:hypothetical protein